MKGLGDDIHDNNSCKIPAENLPRQLEKIGSAMVNSGIKTKTTMTKTS